MSEVLELIRKCEKSGVMIAANGEKLRIDAPADFSDSMKDALRRHKADILKMLANDSQAPLSETLNSMIAAGVTFDVSSDDFQVFGADNLSKLEKIFLTLNKIPILCTLQQALLVKHLFAQKPELRQSFISKIEERGASFEAISEITNKWFARLLDTIQ